MGQSRAAGEESSGLTNDMSDTMTDELLNICVPLNDAKQTNVFSIIRLCLIYSALCRHKKKKNKISPALSMRSIQHPVLLPVPAEQHHVISIQVELL